MWLLNAIRNSYSSFNALDIKESILYSTWMNLGLFWRLSISPRSFLVSAVRLVAAILKLFTLYQTGGKWRMTKNELDFRKKPEFHCSDTGDKKRLFKWLWNCEMLTILLPIAIFLLARRLISSPWRRCCLNIINTSIFNFDCSWINHRKTTKCFSLSYKRSRTYKYSPSFSF